MNLAESESALIGIDWGNSSFRAALVCRDGKVLDRIDSDNGILGVQDGNFESVLTGVLAIWSRHLNLPIVLSGMITSRNGWVETPYIDLPAAAMKLAENIKHIKTEKGLNLHFVSGLATRNNSVPDVVRGEETQIAGVIADGVDDCTAIMPGTHSKWLVLSKGVIEGFATYMTGEIFASLKSHTILGTLMDEGPFCRTAFLNGVHETECSGTELLHALFAARSRVLFDELASAEASDYLSGLLIGAEIRGATDIFGKPKRVILVGKSELSERYEAALGVFGIYAERANEHVAARGQHAIAIAGGLI
ncbi:MAG: 2-dehydro-3-deoxygalactonokinase [Roseovarius sp.]|nr:2-dehydro-3-deoxygalactonokinase [Roseovarius sp.]